MSQRKDPSDPFDFEGIIFSEKNDNSKKEAIQSKQMPKIRDEEALTSYLLVNVLLNLLIEKGIVYPHEINPLLSELYNSYRELRKEK